MSPAARTEEGVTFLRTGGRYRAPLLARQFPSEVAFGFLGRMLPTTETIEMSLEAYRLSPRDSLSVLHGARAVAEAELAADGGREAAPELEAERDTAEEIGRAVARRTQDLWRVGIRWVAVGSSRSRVESVRARLAERLAAIGFRPHVPRFEVGPALAPLRTSAVESRPSGYWQTLTTDGVAALYPFVDETIVQPGGILVGLGLSDASPVFLDRWSQASYSWGIFGTTGSGKSFATALFLLRTRWMRPDTSIVVLDPLGEFARLARALGGSVISLADAAQGRLNPLDPATTGGDRSEKAARVGAMLRVLFPSLRDEESAALDAAVSRLYSEHASTPTFDDLRDALRTSGALTDRLAAFLEVFRSGSLRSLNGPTTLAPRSTFVCVDFRGVAADQLDFHLAYVLDWAYGQLKDRTGPKLLVVDEAHRLASHAATSEFLDRVVRHVRHFEGGVLVVSQNPDDFLQTASGRSLLRNLYAVALLRLPEVSPETRAFFGLTDAEAEWLPRARLPSRFGYSESLWRIGEMHLPLAIIASTPEFARLTRGLGAAPPGPGAAAAAAGSL